MNVEDELRNEITAYERLLNAAVRGDLAIYRQSDGRLYEITATPASEGSDLLRRRQGRAAL